MQLHNEKTFLLLPLFSMIVHITFFFFFFWVCQFSSIIPSSFWERDLRSTWLIDLKSLLMNLWLQWIHINSSSYIFTDPCHYGWCSEDLPELCHPIHTKRRHQGAVHVCNWRLTISMSWFMYSVRSSERKYVPIYHTHPEKYWFQKNRKGVFIYNI